MKDLSPRARSILEAGRSGDDPSPEDRARVRKALSRAIAAGGVIGATAAAGGTASAGVAGGHTLTLWTVGKIIAAVVVVGGVATGVALSLTFGAPGRLTAPFAPNPWSAPPSDAPRLETPAIGVGAARSREVSAPLQADQPPAPHEPPAPNAPEPPAPAAEAKPRQVHPAPVQVQPAADPDTLAAEARRLGEVQGALKDGDAEHALQLLDAQSAEFGEGALGEERAAARVIALCEAGRTAEAQAARERFLQKSPRSPLADRVRATCARPVSEP